MHEFTIALTLPLRGVVLTNAQAEPPAEILAGLASVPALIAARRSAAATAGIVAQQQQALELLRQERDAWRRGLAELQRATAQADAQCAAIVSEVREAAVELAHAIASKLVFQQLAAGTFPTERLVAEVVGRLNTREPTTIRLHPDDLEVVQRADEALKALDPDGHLRLIADPKLARGDCKAVAGEITVVYDLHRQIDEIRRELLSTVTGHAEPGS